MSGYSDYALRLELKREPATAQARRELAALYRGIRKDDPVIARAVRRRAKAAENNLRDAVITGLYESNGEQGALAGLLN